jgi:hypothetical protein
VTNPLVVSIDMGYGHLRAAAPLARALGTDLLHADRPPLADTQEQRLWARARRLYEVATRLSQLPAVGWPVEQILDAITSIPQLHPHRDLSHPTLGTRSLDRLVRRGLGQGLADRLRKSGEVLLTTFYSPAVAADRLGCERVFCVVTDSDINRVWAPIEPVDSRITYLVPSPRAARRLQAYGVKQERIRLTGFPLPDELLGGPDLEVLRRNLTSRLVRLDPEGTFRDAYKEELAHFLGPLPSEVEGQPPLLVFAVGGTGTQAGMVRQLLPSLRPGILQNRFRLALVAGVRREVADGFQRWIGEVGLAERLDNGVEILVEDTIERYLSRFNALLARADILWTKPSELTFYGALGLPLVLSHPVGVHERFNRRWARECGAGLKARDASHAAGWLGEWLDDGTLAAAAWSGFMRMPKFGLYRILETVTRS